MARDKARDRYVFGALGEIWEGLGPYAYPLIRITAGAMLMPHGWGKLFGGGLAGTTAFMGQVGLEPAYPLALYIALLEFVGGALLVLGFLTRLVAIQVVGFMAVAAFHVHWPNGFLWTNAGFEYPLFWGLVALAILFGGGGRLSVDERLPREL